MPSTDTAPQSSRLQLALNVKDLDAAIDFYSKMFGVEVTKRKPGYANFSVQDPPLKLVLFENPKADDRINHLGVEVFGDAEVTAATERLKASGMEHLVEDETTCCYAKANKVWAQDPVPGTPGDAVETVTIRVNPKAETQEDDD